MILLVEDDKHIAEMVQFNLEKQGYQVKHCNSVEEASDFLAIEDDSKPTNTDVDALILDIMLPGKSGLDLCQQLRQQNHPAYIILVTSLSSDTDRIVGLELGADDYLTKPFNMRELQARLKALLRRRQQDQASKAPSSMKHSNQDENKEWTEIKLGSLVLNSEQRLAIMNETPLSLTAKEFDLLFYLASHEGRVYTREDLLQQIWGYGYSGYEHTVNTHINRLRNKLKKEQEDDSDENSYIKTVWGVGYKFSTPSSHA